VPPNNHRRNLAERAIQTFKSHFKAVLAGVDDTFPMRLWDRLLPQTILTLNLLRQSNAIPTVSAWQYVKGNFDYNKTPLAPMGCAVQIHQSNEIRTTWAMKTMDGWYLQSSLEHYRCHVIYVKQTKSERISDSVFFKTKYLTQPTLSPADVISKALIDLTQALKGKSNQKGIHQIEALKQLDAILNNSPDVLPTPIATNQLQRRVTFDETVKAPTETEQRITTTAPTAPKPTQRRYTEPIYAATVEKTIPKVPTPRVHDKSSMEEITPVRTETREKIRKYLTSKTMARIPHRSIHFRQATRTSERAQLIHDKETDTYLNYQQLLKHPKYKET